MSIFVIGSKPAAVSISFGGVLVSIPWAQPQAYNCFNLRESGLPQS